MVRKAAYKGRFHGFKNRKQRLPNNNTKVVQIFHYAEMQKNIVRLSECRKTGKFRNAAGIIMKKEL